MLMIMFIVVIHFKISSAINIKINTQQLTTKPSAQTTNTAMVINDASNICGDYEHTRPTRARTSELITILTRCQVLITTAITKKTISNSKERNEGT